MKTSHLVVLGILGLSVGVLGGLAATGMLAPYLPQSTHHTATPELNSEPANLPQDDSAYAAFDQGQYLTALKLAEEAARRDDPQAHTLIGRIYAAKLKCKVGI